MNSVNCMNLDACYAKKLKLKLKLMHATMLRSRSADFPNFLRFQLSPSTFDLRTNVGAVALLDVRYMP